MAEFLVFVLFIGVMAGLLTGFPVAFVLSGVALWVALLGAVLGVFDLSYIAAFPNRIWGIMTNDLLIAVPLFVFMGVMLARAKIAEELLQTMAELMGNMRAGLGIAVMVVGALLAASTGIVGATVVTMGLISLPVMLQQRYCPRMSSGAICASGTLGQIIPPSIVLILLGDQISSAHQTTQLTLGNLSPVPVSIADIFMGALVPGFGLVALYIVWLLVYSRLKPERVPPVEREHAHGVFMRALKVMLPPLLLIVVVLGSILAGVATATESAAVGAVGAMLLAAAHRRLDYENIKVTVRETARTSAMVFTILIGAALFTLVFRGLGGDELVEALLGDLPGGLMTALALVMLTIFVLGFFLDFIEIIFVVVPIVAPALLAMGANPIWLAILLAVNLQTSFLTPPFGFALFYLRGAAPESLQTRDIYHGVIPFVGIQLIALVVLVLFPSLTTFLPETLYGTVFSAPAEGLPEGLGGESYGVDF